jgi:hypothetical protein
LYNNEGVRLRATDTPLYTVRGREGASSTISCKKYNLHFKQMNKAKIKLIGLVNNPRPTLPTKWMK